LVYPAISAAAWRVMYHEFPAVGLCEKIVKISHCINTVPTLFQPHKATMKTLLLAVLLTLQANACLWVDGTTIDGGHRTVEGLPATILRHAMKSTPEERIGRIIRAEKDEHRDDFSQKELEGAEEILSGRFDRAVEIFKKAEADQPGRYSTAVNLGTAYELNGELEPALKWIREGLRRDPGSHYGTEWLHVEILRTRLKLKENPAYLQNHHVVTLPEIFSDKTPVLTGEGTHTAEEIGGSILYQLEERLVFVKPPDPIVADLLYCRASRFVIWEELEIQC